MTLQQIADKINSKEFYLGNHFNWAEAKAWENYGKQRIYIGKEFVEIVNGKAHASSVLTTQKFYETKSQFIDRSEAYGKLIMPIDVIARYINFMIKK